MSEKVTAKNLQYTQNLPPFLARLHGQVSNSSGPDPILAGRRRAVKPRSGSEEAEDAPVVLDEDGNVVDGVRIGVDGTAVRTVEEDAEADAEDKQGGGGDGEVVAGAVAGIGARKRKAASGRVVGGKEDEDNDEKGAKKRSAEDSTPAAVAKPSAKGKKKAKKIKLSFNEDGE